MRGLLTKGDRVRDDHLHREGIVSRVSPDSYITVNWVAGWPKEMQTTFNPTEAARLLRVHTPVRYKAPGQHTLRRGARRMRI